MFLLFYAVYYIRLVSFWSFVFLIAHSFIFIVKPMVSICYKHKYFPCARSKLNMISSFLVVCLVYLSFTFSGFPSGGIYVLSVLGPSRSLFESCLDFITIWNSWFGGDRLRSPLSCYLTCTTTLFTGRVIITATLQSSRPKKKGKKQPTSLWRAIRHVQCLFVLLVLIVLFFIIIIIFFYYFCRMPLKKPTLSCPQPIQFDSVLLSTFQFSTTKSWILLRGTVVPSDFSVLFDVRKN